MILCPFLGLAINREDYQEAIFYAKCLDNALKLPLNAITGTVSCLQSKVTALCW